MTRSKTRNLLLNPHQSLTHRRAPWEQVYMILEGVDSIIPKCGSMTDWATQDLSFQNEGIFQTTYYQTYGGGPEGGYFICYYTDNKGFKSVVQAAKVHRIWGEPFSFTPIDTFELKERYHVPYIRVPQPVKYH